MKVITPGNMNWSTELTCLNIQCQGELEVEAPDFFQATINYLDGSVREKGIHFTCPECQTHNPVDRTTLEDMPQWAFDAARERRKEIKL